MTWEEDVEVRWPVADDSIGIDRIMRVVKRDIILTISSGCFITTPKDC